MPALPPPVPATRSIPPEEEAGPRVAPRSISAFGRNLLLDASPRQRHQLAFATLLLVLAIGFVDFLVGIEISLLVFYILPVCTAVASLGWRYGVFIAVVCVATWLLGDLAAGARFAHPLVTLSNAVFALFTYCVVVWLFDRMLALHRRMEERVRQRTAALTQLIAERERLENALLEISERERRIIGHELHDGLGQHLTGTALAGQVLGEKLRARQLAEENDMARIVALIEDGIEQTRRLARGLLLAEVQRYGLVPALQDFAADTCEQFHVTCVYSGPPDVKLADNTSATHLFRIAQEAVRNAVRHGKARRIEIELTVPGELLLKVRDNGSGLVAPRPQGLGLSIMAHRAEIIGGRFSIARHPDGGALVTCRLPASSLHHD